MLRLEKHAFEIAKVFCGPGLVEVRFRKCCTKKKTKMKKDIRHTVQYRQVNVRVKHVTYTPQLFTNRNMEAFPETV